MQSTSSLSQNLGEVVINDDYNTLNFMEKNFRNRTKEKRLCSYAVSEILEYELVNEKEILFLVHKYRWLHKAIPYTPNGIAGDFHKLYDSLHTLKYYLDLKPAAIEALEDYQQQQNWDESTIIEWLLKYEDIGTVLNIMLFNTMFSDMEVLGDLFGKLHQDYSLKVGTVDFYHIIDFIGLFDKHYDAIIEKYNTNQEEGIFVENGIEYYEASTKTLIDYIGPALNMPIEEIFKKQKKSGLNDTQI